MGWTFLDRQPTSADAYFREAFADRYTALDSATINLSEYYAALADADRGGEVHCFVALIRWSRDGFGYKDMAERMGPTIANAPARVLDLLSPLPACSHDQEYCRHCGTEIAEGPDASWRSEAKPGQVPEVAGPRWYSGYPISARVGDEAPLHEPGGTAPCGTCEAREWRERCRQNITARERRRLLVHGAVVRLIGAERYELPAEVHADPMFTVNKTGRRVLFRHGATRYRFGAGAQWERADRERRGAA